MTKAQTTRDLDKRQRQHLVAFSNYEAAVTLVCSLEAWFEHRWGPAGREQAGLLHSFNRFIEQDGLTPDFEVRFHTPYVIWGDHKRTMQAASTGRDDAANQILRYASRGPRACVSSDNGDPQNGNSGPRAVPLAFDVVVLVSSENDDAAAEAIESARASLLERVSASPTTAGGKAQEEDRDALAPIIVLGYHRDPDSINGEWYKIKWRDHHHNSRFSVPNICRDAIEEDLNALLVDAPYHPVPVNVPALGLAGRHPLINDTPPPLYTAVRIMLPAINDLLSPEEQDELQTFGKIEKTVTTVDLLASAPVAALSPQPKGLGKWLQAALEFLAMDLKRARKVTDTSPQQFVLTIDNSLLKGDPKELFSKDAARKAAKRARKPLYRGRSISGIPGQMNLPFAPDVKEG
ncbi:MAG: hypothetical protein JXA57_03400 [Armatimonadetes bacterium]|nr:hypothetical protein [Armatimonadota bacterium]